MTEKQETITKADGTAALKIVFHALIRTGMTLDEIIEETNIILQGLIDTEDISLLSISKLGTVKEKHISKLGDLVFDSLRRALHYQGQKVELSPNEQKLMGYFINNPEKLITHKEIYNLLYPETETHIEPAEVCRPLISRLRKRLSSFPEGENWIETVRGEGYVFVLVKTESSK